MATRANVQAMTAGAALLLMAGAVTWWLLDEQVVVPLGIPTYSGDPVEVKTAVVPAIGDFESEFNVNAFNPFIPKQQRDIEAVEIKNKKNGKKPVDPISPKLPKIEEVPIPKLNFPALAPRRKNAPECIGIISSEHGDMLIAHMPGAVETTPIEVGKSLSETGDSTRQWTLIALEQGNVARFRDPAGVEQLFAIGATTPGVGSKEPVKSPSVPAPGPKPPGAKPQGGPRPQRPGHDAQGLPQGGTTDHPQGWSPRPPEPPTPSGAPPGIPRGK